MKTHEIRKKFLRYFQKKRHTLVPSSPVLPHEDPTLLFNNAGMNQFKDVFLGKSKRDYNRATSSQKCIRVGGKHNDLENVGHTKRHLTFFEMLGNFSFGDYFKKEAMQFAWEVSTEIFQFDPKHLWASVFEEDDEAFELWTEWLPTERIVRMGASENFWQMGDAGPCGPCSELYFDRGSSYGGLTSPLEDPDGERFLEFWNLVFMQYNRQSSGEMSSLPNPSIDTGAGLERIMSLIDDVDSVFETDILRELIAQVEEVSGLTYDLSNHHTASAFRVIADHLRCLSFAIADGVQPSNVDRGYVLRKILRRAVRYGRMLELKEPFLARVFPRLVSTMGQDYPELKQAKGRITEILTLEEEAFLRTLSRGGNLMNQVISCAQEHGNHISGNDAFKLKDTYGLPIDEILLLAKDAGLVVDLDRFNEMEKEAKERSRQAHKKSEQIAQESLFVKWVSDKGPCQFLGYTELSAPAEVLGIVVDGEFVEKLDEGQQGAILLNQTPFYAEMGGQIGDTGELVGTQGLFTVKDCQTLYQGVVLHIGEMTRGAVHVGDAIDASVDKLRRRKIANNHTATHLLHWALQRVLGEHIRQAGSVVDSDRLRFDFSHHKALSPQEMRQIEDLINEVIRENHLVEAFEISFEEAQKRPEIKQIFGEKYGSFVRVIKTSDSQELCGGTHTSQLGNIGLFRITKEGSIAAGVRRIEAVTGKEAEALYRKLESEVEELANTTKTTPPKLRSRIEKLIEENQTLTKELKNLKGHKRKTHLCSLLEKEEMVRSIPTLIASVDLPAKELKILMDELEQKRPNGFFVLGAVDKKKCQVMARASDKAIQAGFSARDAIDIVSPIIDGGGGGKEQSAQAGGKAPHKLLEALTTLKEKLSQ